MTAIFKVIKQDVTTVILARTEPFALMKPPLSRLKRFFSRVTRHKESWVAFSQGSQRPGLREAARKDRELETQNSACFYMQ